MNLKDKIRNFHPDTDSGAIADALGVDEDEVIAAIHDVPKLISPHDSIDAWLKDQEFNHCGAARLSKFARENWRGKISSYIDTEGFFQIRNRDPERREYLVTETAIIVRHLSDGDFYDNEYAKDAEIAELIESLRK